MAKRTTTKTRKSSTKKGGVTIRKTVTISKTVESKPRKS
jgi:hypothetical protein